MNTNPPPPSAPPSSPTSPLAAAGSQPTQTRRAIQVLPADLSNQIAAGEVVERPASAVKELVENALDANAKTIFIDLEDGGRKLIRVTDDGFGMSRDDATLSIQRHATSKISSLQDLTAISTLGFRGEALPSIASVSRFSLTSKPAATPVGTLISVEGGLLQSVQDAACNPGTRIEVRDLFFNTPARLKFLKSESTELRRAQDIIMRLALVWNLVHFRFSHNDRPRLDIPPHPDPSDRIFALLGREVYDALHPLPDLPPIDGVFARGFFSDPTFTQASSSSLYTYVNGRFVSDRTISAAIQNAYQDLIPKNRSPFIVINVTVPPEMVDVNVHPTKIEVRFTSTDHIFRAVFRALREGLARAPWVNAGLNPDGSIAALLSNPINLASSSPPTAADLLLSTPLTFSSGQPPLPGSPLEPLPFPANAFPPSASPSVPSPSLDVAHQAALPLPAAPSAKPAINYDALTWAERVLRGTSPVDNPASAPTSTLDSSRATPDGANILNPFSPPSGAPAHPQFFSRLQFIGHLNHHYLLTTDGNALLIIDLRTAHERIALFHLRQRWERRAGETQQLLFPIQIELDALRATLLEEHLSTFQRMGFELEPFGPRVFALKAVPSLLGSARFQSLIRDAIDELSQVGRARSLDAALDAALARIARHASPPADHTLNPAEADAFLLQMDQAHLSAPSASSASVRPVFSSLPIADLDKKFDR
jgi:DNA mismatch repair protein MutL